MLHRVLLPLSSRLIASPSTNGPNSFIRSMSAGSKRDNKNGLPVRRAGGITLPTENEVEDASGRIRYKSRKQLEKEEYQQEKREKGALDEDMKLDEEEEGLDELDEAEEPYDSRYARNDREREPLRPGEQTWRERTLKQSGILQNAPFRQAAREKLRKQPLKPSAASKNNPVLIRTREHLNQADLPPAFDHFKVPPLTAEEIDAKQKDLHASYWSKYIAWKEARPDEYAKWLARLEKREEEQQFHWQQSQLGKNSPHAAAHQIAALKTQSSKKLLPTAQSRASFDEARKSDPSLDAAIKQLGEGEVLRRWNTYQVFLEAEIAAEHKERVANHHIKTKLKRDRALFAEDTLTTLNDDTLKLNVAQKKKLYGMMLGAQYRVNQAPLWTDPDPRFEGEHDWKMADAFVKPPVLPPLHLLKEYSARPETNSNFSSLHRFLHFERLRQTVHFLKEQRRQQTRERKRQLEFNPSEYIQALVKDCKEWPHILKDYSFLSDAVYNGARHLYLSPWPTADQRDFLDALLRNVVTISKLLDVHFSRRNRNAAWILPFPNNPKRNPDEILKPMTQREMKQMEAEVLASQMMQVLETEAPASSTSSSSSPAETMEDQQPATAEK